MRYGGFSTKSPRQRSSIREVQNPSLVHLSFHFVNKPSVDGVWLASEFVVWSIKWDKMVKHCCFPKPKVTFTNVLFSPHHKDIQFTVRE